MRLFDADGLFLSPTEGQKLRQLAIRGAGVTVFAQGITFCVHLVSTIILARLLMPGDFGVVTMVTTFSVLLASCGQIGFPDAVVQRDRMDHRLASNLFWINLAIGFVLTGAFAGAGTLMAKFYGDRRVAHVAVGVSLTILITSASVLHLALLKRAMRFAAVSINDIVARAVSVVVSILLAWLGWGYWSLVVGAVALPFSTSVGAWLLCRWIPSLPGKADGTADTLRFTRNVFARWTIGYFTQNTDNLLVGWKFGPASLGFYKKAYDLFVLPFNLLTVFPVAVSTLSRLVKDPPQYRRYFLAGLSLLALLGMGVGGDLTLVGRDIIRVLLGPKWEMTGRIFMFFGPGVGAMLIYSSHCIIHLSLGTTVRHLRWGIVEVSTTCLLFCVGLPWGPIGVAVAWTAAYWLMTVPAFWYAGRPIGLGIWSIFGVVWRSIAGSVLALGGSIAVSRQLGPLSAASGMLGAMARIVCISLLFWTFYVLSIVLLHWGLAPLRQLGNLAAEVGPWGRFFNRRVMPKPTLDTGSKGLIAMPTEEVT